MFTYELARRLQPANAGSSSSNITANALHPGVVRTELSRYLISDPDSLSGKLLTLLATPFTLSPEEVRGPRGEAESLWCLATP
jgi:retinol dehydrogenase-14